MHINLRRQTYMDNNINERQYPHMHVAFPSYRGDDDQVTPSVSKYHLAKLASMIYIYPDRAETADIDSDVENCY